MRIEAFRYHDFCYGHRVVNHESKCKNLHGHNGRVTYTIEAPRLDPLGRVLDFSVIKSILCNWLEDNWDHKFLAFVADPMAGALRELDPTGVVLVDFNPTAENLAASLLQGGQVLLTDAGYSYVKLVKVEFEETRKCGVCVHAD